MNRANGFPSPQHQKTEEGRTKLPQAQQDVVLREFGLDLS
jgi:hypothetical protein